ncbi:hypothetical protein ACPBEH_02710 [Latilactobacillus sp. 5-91]|uniref:hypothetical protein n=1 Tax=Latilactobacillus sp. 5-91 TaxID=3410924 RepID=UPI003C74DE83
MEITILIIIEILVSISMLLWTKHAWDLSCLFVALILIALSFIKELQLGVACIGLGIFVFATLAWIQDWHK